MAHTAIPDKELYDALSKQDQRRVVELCKAFPEGPLHTITIHKDTVIHVATFSGQADLVEDLLNHVPQDHLTNLIIQNDIGNTILHEAATSNRLVPAAAVMLRMAPQLLEIKNQYGETPLFRTTRYGKIKMFEFLNGEVKKRFSSQRVSEFYHKTDERGSSTILHTSIRSRQFELALLIARNNEYLVGEQDEKGMTALHHLASDPSAFKSSTRRRLLKFSTFGRASSEDSTVGAKAVSGWGVPFLKAIQKEKLRYEATLKLARFLVARDTSWRATGRIQGDHQCEEGACVAPREEENGVVSPASNKSTTTTATNLHTPLFLATRSGCVEIVKETLELYPQAVEHIDRLGRTILHVAVMYRQMEIFDIVQSMKLPMKRLVRKGDNELNSILHMVGKKGKPRLAVEMQSPALQLQEELLLFERIEKICSDFFSRHINVKEETAEMVFERRTRKLRREAKEWLKRTAENCSLVAVLIATVAFAAAYTVPGGSNQDTGAPILLNQPFFVIFTITDVLSLTFALTSVIIFLSILTSPYRLNDFKQSLPQKLMLGFTFLIFSVSMMMLAFAATIILMIHRKEPWTKIALSTVAFLPVSIFAISYMPLYFSLMKTFKYTIKKIVAIFPRFYGFPSACCSANPPNPCNPQSTNLIVTSSGSPQPEAKTSLV